MGPYSLWIVPLRFAYGTVTRYGPAFQPSSAPFKDTPRHICLLLEGIQQDLSGFQSPLLTGSQLVSFPPSTKMLHLDRKSVV